MLFTVAYNSVYDSAIFIKSVVIFGSKSGHRVIVSQYYKVKLRYPTVTTPRRHLFLSNATNFSFLNFSMLEFLWLVFRSEVCMQGIYKSLAKFWNMLQSAWIHLMRARARTLFLPFQWRFRA